MQLSAFTLLCNYHYHPSPELFSSGKTVALYAWNNKAPFSPYSWPLVTTILISVSEFNYSRYLISVESYSIWPSVIVLFHLMFPRFIFESVRISFFFQYVYSTFYLFICHWIQLLSILLLWTGVYTYISSSPVFNSLGYIPKNGMLDHTISLFFNFWGTTILFSTVDTPFYIPINNTQNFQSLYTLANTLILMSVRYKGTSFKRNKAKKM